MAEPLLLQRLRNLVQDVRGAITSRTSSENELATVHLEKAQAAEDAWKQGQVDLQQRREKQLAETDASFKERKLRFAQTAHSELEATKSNLAKSEQEMTSRHYLDTEGLKRSYDDAVWSTKTIYEGDKNSANEGLRVPTSLQTFNAVEVVTVLRGIGRQPYSLRGSRILKTR